MYSPIPRRRRSSLSLMTIPQELRDMILELCTSDYDSTHDRFASILDFKKAISYPDRRWSSTRGTVKNAPWLGLTQACKALADQYCKALKKKPLTLVFIDHFHQHMSLRAPTVNSTLRLTLKHVEFLLVAVCPGCESTPHAAHACFVDQEVRAHAVWVREVTDTLPQLESCRVRMDVCWAAKCKEQWPRSCHQHDLAHALQRHFVDEIPKLTEVDVHRWRRAEVEGMIVDVKNSDLWVTWAKKTNEYVAGPVVEEAKDEETKKTEGPEEAFFADESELSGYNSSNESVSAIEMEEEAANFPPPRPEVTFPYKPLGWLNG